MKAGITDKDYVRKELKISKSEVKTIKEKEDYKERVRREKIKRLEKQERKEIELGEALSSLLSKNLIPADYCEHILPRALRQEILTQSALKEVILEGKKGNCYFYYSCPKRKPECGCKIKRSFSMSKD